MLSAALGATQWWWRRGGVGAGPCQLPPRRSCAHHGSQLWFPRMCRVSYDSCMLHSSQQCTSITQMFATTRTPSKHDKLSTLLASMPGFIATIGYGATSRLALRQVIVQDQAQNTTETPPWAPLRPHRPRLAPAGSTPFLTPGLPLHCLRYCCLPAGQTSGRRLLPKAKWS